MENIVKARGGKRPGAGRPSKADKYVEIRVRVRASEVQLMGGVGRCLLLLENFVSKSVDLEIKNKFD